MVLVALDVAAPALQSRRRLEHVPQWLCARLTVGGEVVEGGNELVAFVADVIGLFSNGMRLHGKLWLLFAFTFIGIKNLESGKRMYLTFSAFNNSLNNQHAQRNRTFSVELGQTWNILGISLESARYTSV